MKTRFSTIDLVASVAELQSILHMRIVNVYDIDHKTYLFKLSKQEEKAVLLVESGSRIHRTEFEWPKNPAPSSFTMKMRKHIHNRRLEQIRQLGIDRIVDLQFGCNEAAYHVIIELYDRGNIILTDYEFTILNVLRPRTENESVRFLVHEKYPVDRVKQHQSTLPEEKLREILLSAKEGDNLRKVLNPHLEYGPALIDHVLLGVEFPDGVKIGKGFNIAEDLPRLTTALEEAEDVVRAAMKGECKGIITQKSEKLPKKGEAINVDEAKYLVYNEFYPNLFRQHEQLPYLEFPSFNKAVDEFYSKLESQKLDIKAIHQEKEALKKLENVRKDHEQRIGSLQKFQEEDKTKAELIEMNLELIEKAILIVQSAIANQMDWKEISSLLQEATQHGDPVAKSIKGLKLEMNFITMLLTHPFSEADDQKPQLVDIDLDMTAYANAKRYYVKKKHALKKEQKTVESSTKAYKSAEKKVKQTLKEVATVTSINKARKTHWFEKFLWFVSSENYLVIGGRDQQQNEIVVKRYLRTGDVYVHADLHGASSIVIKNASGKEIPPKTLNEAGTMAVCSSAAWESRVVTSAWWVHPDQVSKTAPTGEYLTTGSFMVRGKKNYLPPCYLIMGFGFLFRLDEECVANHKDERKVRSIAPETEPIEAELEEDVEINLNESDEDEPEPVLERAEENVKPVEEEDDIEDGKSKTDEDETERTSPAFPDTVIDLEHVEGDRFVAKPRTICSNEDIIYLGDAQPIVLKPGKRVNKPTNQKTNLDQNLTEETSDVAKSSVEGNKTKRGQKFKMKKMKLKYKDQDEEDRQLAMSILQSAGKRKEKKVKESNAPKQRGMKQAKQMQQSKEPKLNVESEKMKQKPAEEEGGSDDENEAKQQAAENAALLDSLTGIPTAEDTLLYAIPMCAPYNAIVNYKFKVKLMPGSGKRGKAAKTALGIFLHDKITTPRERDLFRSIKDQDISRNLPGKVKLSAPQFTKQKLR